MTHDREYYQKIGKMGRESLINTYGYNAMAIVGRRGGTLLWKKRGSEYMRQLGRKGAETTMRRYGQDHMKEISRRGGQRVKDLIEYGKRFENEVLCD